MSKPVSEENLAQASPRTYYRRLLNFFKSSYYLPWWLTFDLESWHFNILGLVVVVKSAPQISLLVVVCCFSWPSLKLLQSTLEVVPIM